MVIRWGEVASAGLLYNLDQSLALQPPVAGPRAERTEGGKIRCVKNVLLASTSNFYGGNKIE